MKRTYNIRCSRDECKAPGNNRKSISENVSNNIVNRQKFKKHISFELTTNAAYLGCMNTTPIINYAPVLTHCVRWWYTRLYFNNDDIAQNTKLMSLEDSRLQNRTYIPL